MKKIIGLYIAIMMFQFAYSQSFKSLLREGDKAFRNQDYVSALAFYGKAYEQNPMAKIHFKIAKCEYWTRNYSTSLKTLKKMRKDWVEKYPLIDFYIGLNYKSLSEHKKAVRYFKRYYRKHRKTKDFYTLKAKHEIEACTKSIDYQTKADSSILVRKLDLLDDPSFSALQYNVLDNGDTLLLSTHPIDKKDSLHYARLFRLKNGQAYILNHIHQDFFQIGHFSQPSGTNKMYLSACVWVNGKRDCSIYQSERINDVWSPIKKLKAPINQDNINDIHPFVFEQNGKTYLLFASDREGGKGAYDLYYSELENGQFSKVKHLKRVNSIENEISPSYDTLKQRLYFSSQWFDNLGGYDIFYAEGVFPDLETPKNMGAPINSTYDDVYYNWSNFTQEAYFSSNRPNSVSDKNATCCNQIYAYNLQDDAQEPRDSVKLITEKIDEMEQLIPINLYFDNDQPNPKTLDTLTLLNYENTYSQYFKRIKKYEHEFSKGLKNTEKEEAVQLIDDFFYDKLEHNFDKFKTFNQMLIRILKEGYDVNLIVKGFASPLNSSDYNVNLSKRRICSIINYYQQVDEGVFQKYIQNGQLGIEEIAFGDTQASTQVSDSRKDIRNSIYNPQAAAERRVQILAFKLSRQD